MQQTEFSKMCQLYFDHCYAYHEVVLRGRFVELRLFRYQLKTKILKSVWTFLGYVRDRDIPGRGDQSALRVLVLDGENVAFQRHH
jgi:hypothetical protein